MLEFVSNGLGVALVQESIVESCPELRAIPLSDPTLTWTLGIITPAPEHVSPAAREFLELLRVGLAA
jgi:DNA-binding transcriptional LysR family regulator